ncbi:MAG TPA: HAD family phosphatase [Paenirhodobacter sp.]
MTSSTPATPFPRFKGIAWDVDGTLVDSEPLHHEVLISVCLDLGIDLRNEPEGRFIGVSQDEMWGMLTPRIPAGLTREAWKTHLIEAYIAGSATVRPMSAALDVIARFADAGIRQIVVSNAGRRVLDANIAALGIGDILMGSISVDEVTQGKPAPEPYQKGAQLLGLGLRDVLAVEDSGTGARAAKAAGIAVATLGMAQSVGGLPIGSLADLPALVLG